MIMNSEIKLLQEYIDKSKRIVFFGGAGVSTESGIPDFRSTDGLYNQKYRYPPEKILSHTFFMNNTSEFYRFYKEKMIFLDAQPNRAHCKLAEMEKAGKLAAVITQNIDGLHQKAGSTNVMELHGSVYRNFCTKCHKSYDIVEILRQADVPKCECGGIIKPDVVLYEEMLDNEILRKSVEYISSSDMLIVGGTSLAVYPAAGLINYYKGNRLVLINKASTSYDSNAGLIINGKIGEVMSQIII